MARFREHEQVQLEIQTRNQCAPDERRMLDEQHGNHLESVSVPNSRCKLAERPDWFPSFYASGAKW